MSWREFWNGAHSIYVSPRHQMLHDRIVARDIAALVPSRDAIVLDYGCGEAGAAEDVACRCSRLILSDAAPAVRGVLTERYAGHPTVTVMSPEEVQTLPRLSLDLIVVNSLLQYLSRAELDELLAVLHPLLKDTGVLVIGDVIPHNQSALADAAALLRFGFQGGFLISALLGLARTFFSEYRKLRSTLGLSSYDEAEMLAVLEAAGFVAERRHPNLGHNQGRATFMAVRRREGSGGALSRIAEGPEPIHNEAPEQHHR
jgi:SAM-dependent methyltransferase